MTHISTLAAYTFVLILYTAVSCHRVRNPLDLCKNLKRRFPYIKSGEYSDRGIGGYKIRVFCEYLGTGGYTYLPKRQLMYFPSTKVTHVNVKHLRSNHMQYDVNLRQTSSFSRLPLSIQYDSHRGYARPVNYNRLNSYIYLGFLPKTAASAKVTQGYKANKKDFTFRNCDGNPNSYLVFYHNNDSSAPLGYYKRCCYTKLMRGWIDQSKPAKTFLPADYFFQTEMHMGGCGGYAVSGYNTQTDIYGAALGIPFDL